MNYDWKTMFYQWLAWRLPIELVAWCVLRVWAYATSQRTKIADGQTIPLDASISLDDALGIFQQRRDRKIYGHTQALDEQKGWSIWRSGRAWWHIYETKLHAEWLFFGHSSTGIGFSFAGDEKDFGIHVAINRLFSIWLSIDHTPILRRLFRPLRGWHGYDTSIKMFDGAIWVHVAYDEKWGARTVRHRFLPDWINLWKAAGYKDEPGVGFYFSIHYLDVLFGGNQHEEVELWPERITAEIPIEPDNSFGMHYIGSFMAERHTWYRKYFPMFKHVHHYVDIQMEKPPMHQGKGENSWDLDDDGIFGMGVPGTTLEEGIAGYQNAVKRDRKKYGMGSAVLHELEKRETQQSWRALMEVPLEQGSGGVIDVPLPPAVDS